MKNAQGKQNIYLKVDKMRDVLVGQVPQVRKMGFVPVQGKALAPAGGKVNVAYGVVANNAARVSYENGEWKFVESPLSMYGVEIYGRGAKATPFTPGGNQTAPPVFKPDYALVSFLEEIDGVIAYNHAIFRPPYSPACVVKRPDGNSDSRTPLTLKFTSDCVSEPSPEQVDSWIQFRAKLAEKIGKYLTARGYNPNEVFELLILGYANRLDEYQAKGYTQPLLGVSMCAWVVYILPYNKHLREKFGEFNDRAIVAKRRAARIQKEVLTAHTDSL